MNADLSETSVLTAPSLESTDASGESVPVTLNVYGLTEPNEKLRPYKVGIYHIGVQVHGREWSYGYHRYPISGIFRYKPRDHLSLSQDEHMFYPLDPIIVGTTRRSLVKITSWLIHLGRTDWTGLKYHIIHKNSFTFAHKMCQHLCGVDISRYPWLNCRMYINKHQPEVLASDVPLDFRSPVALREIVRQKIEYARICKQKQMYQTKLNAIPKEPKSVKENLPSMTKTTEQPGGEGKCTEVFSRTLNEESFGAFLDSTFLAAPSMEDFEKEVKESSKEMPG